MALRIFRPIKNTLETIAESSFIIFITHLLHILAGRRLTFAFFHLLLRKATVVAETSDKHIFSQ